MQIDLDKLSIDSLIQIILIIFFIIQTAYLVRQTNFGVRSSQANLMEVWRKELQTVDIDLLYVEPNVSPNEQEFQKLIDIVTRMQYQFKEKLLKPADFSAMFIALHFAIQNDNLRKTTIFRENYLKLQTIYIIFKRDIDVALFLFRLPSTSMYEEILKDVKRVKGLDKIMLSNWVQAELGFRIALWWQLKVKRKDFFVLSTPIEK